MRVIIPIQVTSSVLISSTIPEPDTGEPSLWVATTNYGIQDRVYRNTTHKIYEAVVAGVDATLPEDSIYMVPPKWIEIGPTNRYAMFDTLRNTGTTANTSMTVVLVPGVRVDSIALLGMTNVTTVYIEAEYGSTTVEIADVTIEGSNYINFEVPPYYGVTLTVTVSGVGLIACGAMIIGRSKFIGNVQKNVKDDTLNFSVVDRDSYGYATLEPIRNLPKINLELFSEAKLVNRLIKIRNELNAASAVWCGLDDPTDDYYDTLLILGFYKTFTIDLDNPIGVLVSLELEEI